jgi:hypothetical protein
MIKANRPDYVTLDQITLDLMTKLPSYTRYLKSIGLVLIKTL